MESRWAADTTTLFITQNSNYVSQEILVDADKINLLSEFQKYITEFHFCWQTTHLKNIYKLWKKPQSTPELTLDLTQTLSETIHQTTVIATESFEMLQKLYFVNETLKIHLYYLWRILYICQDIYI